MSPQETTVQQSALGWVKASLDDTLEKARQDLTLYVEEPANIQLLIESNDCLKTVQGTLEMVEYFGAAILAEEMSVLCLKLADETIDKRDSALEVLLRAVIHLSDYLDYLVSGKKDVPMLLLPLINDIRAVQNARLLSEQLLFLPDLSLHEVVPDEDMEASLGEDKSQALAKKLRSIYQLGFVGIHKGVEVADNLARMRRAVESLEAASKKENAARFWWIVGAMLESLQLNALDISISVKLLLGKIDREIKRLIDDGEVSLSREQPLDLIKNLLYYIATCETEGVKATAVKDVYQLNQYLPNGALEGVEGGPVTGLNLELFKTVADSVKADLDEVKSLVEMYVTSDLSDVETLKSCPLIMARIADTLAMLGFGPLRQLVAKLAKEFAAVIDADATQSVMRMENFASQLLQIDQAMDEYREGRVEGEYDDAEDQTDPDFIKVKQVTIDQSLQNIKTLKEAITDFILDSSSKTQLEHVPGLIQEICGAMRVLGQEKIIPLLDDLRHYTKLGLLQSKQLPDAGQLDMLGHVVATIEYYFEGLHENRENIEDVLERAIQDLDFLSGCVSDIDVLSDDESVAGEEGELGGEPTEAEVVAIDISHLAIFSEDTDQEIVDIFLEEVDEEIAQINSSYARWKGNQADEEAVTTMRRAFHTLKGSGRFVGAMLLGEFCWEHENLFNRIIEKTIPVTPDLFTLMDASIVALAGLAKQLTDGQVTDKNIGLLMANAAELAQTGRSSTTMAVAEPAPSVSVEEVDDEAIESIELSEPVADEILELPDPGGIEVEEQEVEIEEEQVLASLPADDEAPTDEEPVASLGQNDLGTEISSVPVATSAAETNSPSINQQGNQSPTGVDPILLEIFAQEVTTHLGTVNAELDNNPADNLLTINDPLYRALHTINGAASMGGFASIAQLASSLERLLIQRNEVSEDDTPGVLNENDLAACQQGTNRIQEHLQFLIDNGESDSVDMSLIADIDHIAANPTPIPVSAATTADKLTKPEAPAENELLDIFLEEAFELLDASEAAMHDWGNSLHDMEIIQALQRHLHTLKGGARMAELEAVGDLSHTIESLFISLCETQLQPTEVMLSVLNAAFDRLHAMVNAVQQGGPVGDGVDLIDQLEMLRKGEQLPSQEAPVIAPLTVDDVVEESAELLSLSETEVAVATTKEEEERRANRRSAADMMRVKADLLDDLVSYAGESNIYRARIEQQISSFDTNLTELNQTISRIHGQLRALDNETEAQILSTHREAVDVSSEAFDPLEMDRYTAIQELSRALNESVGDLKSLRDSMVEIVKDSETLLVQQSRVNTDLQDGLIRTRMVEAGSFMPRLRRIVRQTSDELDKKASVKVIGAEYEIDSKVMDRMIAPLEHLLRNAVVHGLEAPDERTQQGKNVTGVITIQIGRDGSDVILKVSDDGRGIDLEAVREKALEMELMTEESEMTDQDLKQFILEPGFTTAKNVSQIAGRGVGMDVVNSEIKQLGGSLKIDSETGTGTVFTARLPFTLAINQAIMVRLLDDEYAIPIINVEGILLKSSDDLVALYETDHPVLAYGGEEYQLTYLGDLLGTKKVAMPAHEKQTLLMLRAADHRIALHVDELLGRHEIVVKSIGAQLSQVGGLAGATILADGRVIFILDIAGLLRMGVHLQAVDDEKTVDADLPLVMVVDDSITMRKVTSKMLEKNDFEVITAKDGIDAIDKLQDHHPVLMILDIEMPRMDGFELAAHIRNDDRVSDLPIIMVTSRTGEKHKTHAIEIGVNRYLGKPYQEDLLMENINDLLQLQQAVN